jgi:O-antigen ligase
MGVGANQYVVVANTQGYSQRAGVIWNWASRSANVHNTYLLVAAETGWFGLISFITMFTATIVTGLKFAFQDKRDPRGDIVLGSTVAMIVTAGHNFYEWIWVTYQAQYVFAISVGIVAGLERARARERRARRRSAAQRLAPPLTAAPITSALAPAE